MRLRVGALLARGCGLRVLDEALLRHPAVERLTVFTHGRSPRAEGGGPRAELDAYRTRCAAAGVPLVVLDGPEASDLGAYLARETDLLLAVSWRNLVAEDVLRSLRIGAVNLHRGALPRYAGAEPVRRAIEAAERDVTITAHRMTPEIDGGDEIARVSLRMPPRPARTCAADYAETVKAWIEPLYPPLARLALDAVVAEDAA